MYRTTWHSEPSFLCHSRKGQAQMTNSEIQRQTWCTPLKARREAVCGVRLAQLSHGLRLQYINLMHHEEIASNLEGCLVVHCWGFCEGSVLHMATTVLFPPSSLSDFRLCCEPHGQARPVRVTHQPLSTMVNSVKPSVGLSKGAQLLTASGCKVPVLPRPEQDWDLFCFYFSDTGPVEQAR